MDEFLYVKVGYTYSSVDFTRLRKVMENVNQALVDTNSFLNRTFKYDNDSIKDDTRVQIIGKYRADSRFWPVYLLRSWLDASRRA
jgi:hypothetical protein